MLWAAACTVFCVSTRRRVSVPSQHAYNPRAHLSLLDIAFDSYTDPKVVYLHLKKSKTDPFRQGIDIYVGATGSDVCPVNALLQYIGVRSNTAGPLFIFHNGQFLTKPLLVSHRQRALQQAGLEHKKFNGHSFRIGAATTAAQCGIEDSLIQTLGRWKSDAYKYTSRSPARSWHQFQRLYRRTNATQFARPPSSSISQGTHLPSDIIINSIIIIIGYFRFI